MLMTYKIIILLSMVFCHVVDDYYLQGWLASSKQRSWWEKNYPENLYKYDYIAALFMHSFSWSFMIMVPPTVALIIIGEKWYPIILITNLVIHMYIDNLKSNKKKINLIQDQAIHMLQVVLTWWCLIGRL